MSRPRVVLGVIAVAIAIATAGVGVVTLQEPSPTSPTLAPAVTEQQSPDAATAASQAEAIPLVQGVAPEYRRDEFGDAWVDVDDNGCSTRNDVLARDLVDVTWLPDRSCVVGAGVLEDPYTGQTIEFEFGEVSSRAVSVDHVVPLVAAWNGGAWQWSDAERVEFANDLANLEAVDGPTNSSKGGSTIADWLPPNVEHHCSYVAQYVDVVSTWDLAWEARDAAAALTVLQHC